MWQARELLRHARNGEAFGDCSNGTSYEYKAFLKYWSSTTEQLATGVVSLLSFKDVPANAWFAKTVEWVASNGLVNGYSKDTFAPNDPITCECK